MTVWGEKHRVTVGDVSLELPAALVKGQETPTDSAAGVFEGHGLTVIIDQGPFSDRLDSHVGRPGYQEEIKEIAGTPARIVSFRNPEEGTYTLATHLAAPKGVTVVVRADESVPDHVPREIVESLQLHR